MASGSKIAVRWLALALLVTEPLYVLLGGWFRGMLPLPLQEFASAQHDNVIIVLVAFGLGICMLVGLVGLALFKRWGRTLYTVSWAGDLLLVTVLSPLIRAPLQAAFSEANVLASGALLALAWFSPAREIFARKPRDEA